VSLIPAKKLSSRLPRLPRRAVGRVVNGPAATQGDENGFCSATALHGSVALPFVIPTGAVAQWRDLQFSQPAPDSDRSAALPFVIPTEAVAQWRDLQFSQPASALDGNSTVTFVIPTEAYPDFLLRSTIDRRVCGFP
jgi:hypothetical protein